MRPEESTPMTVCYRPEEWVDYKESERKEPEKGSKAWAKREDMKKQRRILRRLELYKEKKQFKENVLEVWDCVC